MNKFFKRLALLLAVLMFVSMMPVQLFADNSVIVEGQSNGTGENGTGENSYLTISGIAGFEGRQFASFAEAYTAIKPVLERLCAGDALGQGVATAEAFDALFTNRDENGNATLTYTISGNIVYDETGYANLLTMGRRASHYGNDRHLINFKFVGATGKEADTLTVNSDITLPYEWWSEKTVTSISFENLTITGSAPSGLYPSQPYFEGINFKVDNCNLKGIKIYNCSNVKGTYTITNSTLDGTGTPADAYAIHLQGNETEPLTINISGNTISGYDRGINIDQKTANATISGNTISIKDAGRSCIQLSNLTSTVISNNTLELTGGNAITLHEKLLTLTAVPKITVEGNTITGNGYLIYDGAAAKSKAFTSENLTLAIGTNTVASTVDTTQGVYDGNKYGISETVATVVDKALTPAYVATVNGVGYTSLAEAIANATPNANGVITYEISGKATVDSTGWIQVARAGLTGLTKVEFVGKTSDAEICITGGLAILADQNYDIDVSFEALTLSKPNPEYGGDYGHSTNYFTTWLRNTNAAENTVTYTNCTFPNGACNNQFGKTVVDGCTFSNTTAKLYNFWNYSNVLDGETTGVANTEIKNSTFTGVRGIKIYSEKTHGGEVLVSNTTFDGLTEKAAIVASKATDITLDKVSATDCTEGLFQKDIEGSSKDEKITITANGSAISGTFNITADKTTAAAKEEFNISGGTFTSEVSSDYLADGFELKKNIDGTYGVTAGKYVAQIGDVKYETLEEAVAAVAKNGDTITLLEDCKSDRINLEDKSVTVVLNGKTLTSTAAYGVMFCAKNGNKITIDGTVEGSKLVGTLMITAKTDGHIEVNGGTYESNQYCPIYVNGAVNSENSTVTVKNAIIKATNISSDQDMGCGVYLAGYSTSVFENCTITAPITGIEIRAGKLTLNNCDVTGGNGEVTADANGNGTTVTNAALAISQHTTKKPIEVTINGGTFNGTAAVYQTDVQGTGSADVKIAVKSGTFNGTISGETDGTIAISGGKFKVKVDDKYFDGNHACSTDTTDGYYTVAGHPITKVGLTLGEDISIRIVVDAKYKDGKIKVTYETYDPNTKGMVTKELIINKCEYAGLDEEGNKKYQFRISNVTPQMADVVFTLQYLDSEGNKIGSAKQISIVEYCRKFAETNKFEAYKAKIGQLLNYCATAMDFRAVSHKDDMYNGLSWAKRATALRAKISEFGYTVADIDFGKVGQYSNAAIENIVTGFGIEFAESIKLYYFTAPDNYKDGYTYVADGLLTPVPVYEDGVLIGYRVYLTVAMDGYHAKRTLKVYDANGEEVQRIGMAPDYALKYLYNSDKQTTEFKQLCKAAYQYFIAFAE